MLKRAMPVLLRYIFGSLLLLIALWALFDFHSLQARVSFLSADGAVEPFMIVMLRLTLLAGGVVGSALLTWNSFIGLLSAFQTWLGTIHQRKYLSALIIGSLVVRLAAILLMPSELWDDSLVYDDLARQWAAKGDYYNGDHLTAYRPPGYPLFLSRIYLLFGNSATAAMVANALLGMAIVLLSYYLARRIWNESIARLSGCLVAIFPSQVFFSTMLASEPLFTVLFLSAMLLFIAAAQESPLGLLWAIMGGVILGLATLTRTITVSYLVLVVTYWIFGHLRFRRVAIYSLLAMSGFLLVITPWMNRNSSAVGNATLSTATGVNLYIGNQPGSGMGYNRAAADLFADHDPSREVHNDSVAWRKARDYITADPAAFVKRGILKVGFLFISDFDALQQRLKHAAENEQWDGFVVLALFMESFYLLVLLLAITGICISMTRPQFRTAEVWLLVLTIVLWAGVHFLFFAKGRYHFPLIPIIAGFAAATIAQHFSLPARP